jgi:hypothetical protein
MTDYILTYLGIPAGVIEEANPLMVWLFELPFIAGLAIRMLMAALVICLPVRIIKSGKISPVLAAAYYGAAYLAYALIIVVHLYWIIKYALMN